MIAVLWRMAPLLYQALGLRWYVLSKFLLDAEVLHLTYLEAHGTCSLQPTPQVHFKTSYKFLKEGCPRVQEPPL